MTEIESHNICEHLLSLIPQYDKVRLEKHLEKHDMTFAEFMCHNINGIAQKDEVRSDSELSIPLEDHVFLALLQQNLSSPPAEERWNFKQAMINSMEEHTKKLIAEDPELAQMIEDSRQKFPDRDALIRELIERDKQEAESSENIKKEGEQAAPSNR